MLNRNKIRVGIVGANPSRGFASIAHIPALKALPDFEISAVCTTRQDSAEAAARHYGVPLAFCDAEKLAQHPDVDLVTVSVKVPDHYVPVMAAIEAGSTSTANGRSAVTPTKPPGCPMQQTARESGMPSDCKARYRRDQLHQGPDLRWVRRPSSVSGDDRLRPELGT
jgi:hypothetical protein